MLKRGIMMSETITIKKKKKKYDYEAVAKRLKPMITKWKDLDEEIASELHKEYLKPECNFFTLCKVIGLSYNTVYRLFDNYELPRKHPAKAEALQEYYEEKKELEPAVVEDELETEIEDRKFKEAYTILKNAQRLNVDIFQVPEKQELIEELQATIKKLTTLLLKLESDIEG